MTNVIHTLKQSILIALILLLTPDYLCSAPVPRRKDLSTHSYVFTARVRDDGGITPFKVGTIITGTVTWDVKARKIADHGTRAMWSSKLCSITFQVGSHRFSGAGEGKVGVNKLRFAETISFVAHDLKMPMGWAIDHTSGSDSYAILLQNVPTKNVIKKVAIPEEINLADFVSARDLRLDFFHGVSFPGGQAQGQCTVYATIEGFKPAPK